MDNETIDFEQVVAKGCGLDVHKETVVATVSGTGIKRETRTFSTFTRSLKELKEWILSLGITHVAMESTGIYWKPVFNILEGSGLTILIVNARHIKYVPGHKTDKKDSAWIAKLLLAGLLKGSFVPPVEIRQLRDMTRYRRKLEGAITAEKNRMIKMLEDSNMKLSSVLSKVHGVSGTRIVDALLEGKTDPVYLASLCHGKVKAEQEDIILALEGNLTEHHKFMIRIIRQDIRQTEALIKELDAEIEKQLLPYAQEISLLSQIPGVGEQTAGELISEIGVDMEVFATDKHISSWAGVSPGNNESAGKKKSGRTTHGNKQVKSLLTESAWAASRTKGTFLSSKYKKLVGKRGKKRAVVAVAHAILVIAYHLIKEKKNFGELGASHVDERKREAQLKYYQKRIEELGAEIPETKSA
jgi:transposase